MQQPQAVLALPDRATCLLWSHAFAAAGWRSHSADTRIDALAIAFNVDANLLVTAIADPTEADTGIELIAELAADEELRGTPTVLLIPDGVRPLEADEPRVSLAREPCDPYWIIAEADARLGRETPPGLGHLVAGQGGGRVDDMDATICAWWWALAAADLARRARGAGCAQYSDVASLLARRTGVEIRQCASRPDGTDLAEWQADSKHVDPWIVSVSNTHWWRISPLGEPLTANRVACIGAVVGAIREIAANA